MVKISGYAFYTMVFFIFLFPVTSCISYEEVYVNDIKNIELVEFSGKDITLSVEAEIINPNNYAISVTDSEFDIFVEKKPLGTFEIDNNLKLEKKSKEYHKLIFKMDVDQISKDAQGTLLEIVLSGKNQVDLKVEGFIKAKAFLMQRKFQISYKEQVDLNI